MSLSEKTKAEALAHAKEEYPRECCGLVAVVKGRTHYFPCRNLADTPDEHFVLDPDQYSEIEDKGEIISIIHSHPKTNHSPSQADLVACEKSGVPWFVVNPQTELWGSAVPTGFKLPYVGREFSHGLVDCYTLVRDWYKGEFGVELNDYHRRDKWWDKGENMYLDNFKKEGFKAIPPEDVGYGDLFLMHLESTVPNHAAIYIGDMTILHHVQGRLSSRDVYGGYYQKNTARVLRHESR